MIDGAPEVHPPTPRTAQPSHKMPSVTRARAPSPEPLRHRRSELQHPAADADRFIGNIEPSLRKEILHGSVAQGNRTCSSG
jgi:hypothetical protein